MARDPIPVEVAYAEPERQFLERLEVPPGTTAAEAVARSGLAQAFPAVDLGRMRLGIWGQPVERDRVLAAGDRVEIYRPLQNDPREARRRLAEQGATMGAPADDDAST